jgi:hypothetical protein
VKSIKVALINGAGAKWTNHSKDSIQIESAAKSIRKQIQLLPAAFTPPNQFRWSRHLKGRAR